MNVSLQTGDLRMFSIEPPGSGHILGFILNILDEYGLTPESMNEDQKIVTHQRITEAMKWAYAKRTELGDAYFVDVSEVSNIIITLSNSFLYTCKKRKKKKLVTDEEHTHGTNRIVRGKRKEMDMLR